MPEKRVYLLNILLNSNPYVYVLSLHICQRFYSLRSCLSVVRQPLFLGVA